MSLNPDIENVVRTIVEEVSEREIRELDANLELFGLDSIMFFEIEDRLEERYGITIGNNSSRLTTLRSTIELVQELLN